MLAKPGSRKRPSNLSSAASLCRSSSGEDDEKGAFLVYEGSSRYLCRKLYCVAARPSASVAISRLSNS